MEVLEHIRAGTRPASVNPTVWDDLLFVLGAMGEEELASVLHCLDILHAYAHVGRCHVRNSIRFLGNAGLLHGEYAEILFASIAKLAGPSHRYSPVSTFMSNAITN